MPKGAVAATAVALNLLGPGAGHLYLGRARRFAIPLTFLALLVLGLGWSGALSKLPGFALAMLLAVALVLFAIVDAALLGFRMGRSEPKWYTRWYVLVAWIAALVAFAELWPSVRESALGYATYRIPGAYMRPTFSPGDILLVDTRVPAEGELAPNTLVVFRHPDTGTLYILRIKGHPSPGTYSLSTGLPFAASTEVPRANISGLVTALLWSPERRECGRALK